jgi:hypothetical protein
VVDWKGDHAAMEDVYCEIQHFSVIYDLEVFGNFWNYFDGLEINEPRNLLCVIFCFKARSAKHFEHNPSH